MSQHATACNESGGTWLPLIEYSVKSGISLSTIRRKIKSNSIPYRLENGRYLILFEDKPLAAGRMSTMPALTPVPPRPTVRPAPQPAAITAATESEDSLPMLVEAFEHALKEKDERIQLLEKLVADLDERINELRLLVRVLEEKYEVRY